MKNKITILVFYFLLITVGLSVLGILYSQKNKLQPKNINTVPSPQLFQVLNVPISPTPQVSYPENFIWKQFAIKAFGISFLYPSTINTPVVSSDFPSPIKSYDPNLKMIPLISIKDNNPVGPDDVGPISIEKLGDTTMLAWLEANAKADKMQNGSYFPVRSAYRIYKTSFNGYRAYFLFQKYNSQVPSNSYLVQVRKIVYLITFDSTFPDESEKVYKDSNDNFVKNDEPKINAILASIKFY